MRKKDKKFYKKRRISAIYSDYFGAACGRFDGGFG